ncbi:hypothetical protein TRVA0_014S02608 [Trichomonascus vanleenenianus]|uniref:cell wall mannoprotein 1 family protein n=1 Tax=Trichomonascus vanleenenianus TaxID=2268995 RepID=UPI003ECA9157
MLSKLSSISLALAVLTAYACDLSSGGQTVQTDFEAVISSNQLLLTDINSWQTSSGLLGALPIATQANKVLQNVKQVNTDLSALSPTDCDVATIISQLTDSAPSITATLQAITNRAADFSTAGATSVVVSQLNDLASATMALIGTTYQKVPCQSVGQAFDALNDIIAAFASAQKAYDQTVTSAPAQPSTCGATSAAGTTAPATTLATTAAPPAATTTAAPPVCVRKVKRSD